jgi:hypothetical protein
MKRKIFALLLCLNTCHVCYSQKPEAPKSDSNIQKTAKKWLIASIFYIVKLTDSTSKTTRNLIITLDDINYATSIPYGDCMQVCKELGVNTIAIIYTKPGVKFISLKDIFKIFHIASIYNDLPVRIDNQTIDNPETIEAEESEIFTVKVVKQPGSDSFLNIITKHPD